MKTDEIIKDRLKNVMLSNRLSGIENTLYILKSDLFELLTNYMEIYRDDIEIVLDCEDETYTFNINVKTSTLYNAGKIIL